MWLSAALISAGLTTTQEVSRDLRPVDAPDILEVVAENKGRVVLLNFWATWCPPCKVEFPDLVSLQKAYRDRGLVVISVSADFPSQIDSELLPFLEKHRPTFPIYLKETDDIDEFIRIIDPQWTGAMPATFFFAPDGDVASKKFSVMTKEEMVKVVEGLLKDATR